MKLIFVALIVVAQLWTLPALARPEVDSAASSVPSFDESVAKAQATLKSVSEHLSEMVGLPKIGDANSVYDAFKNSGNDLVKNLSETVDKIKAHVDSSKNEDVSAAVKSVQENLQKTVDNLKKEVESPEMKAKTKQIQEQFTKSLNDIVEEASKLSKSVVGDKSVTEELQKLSKQVVDQAVSAADQLQHAVHEATGHNKSDSHHDHAAHAH